MNVQCNNKQRQGTREVIVIGSLDGCVLMAIVYFSNNQTKEEKKGMIGCYV